MDHRYAMRACLFAPDRHSGMLAFSRFATLAEAIRATIEDVSPAHQARAFIDVGDETLSITPIRALYDHPDYPLPRLAGPLPRVA
jgi:hypothetical protein